MHKSAFYAALNAELEKTRSTITELRELTAMVAPDEAIGRISRMDAINNKAINDAALRKAEEKLAQLERIAACGRTRFRAVQKVWRGDPHATLDPHAAERALRALRELIRSYPAPPCSWGPPGCSRRSPPRRSSAAGGNRR